MIICALQLLLDLYIRTRPNSCFSAFPHTQRQIKGQTRLPMPPLEAITGGGKGGGFSGGVRNRYTYASIYLSIHPSTYPPTPPPVQCLYHWLEGRCLLHPCTRPTLLRMPRMHTHDLYRLHLLEGAVVTWTKQIRHVLKQDPETLLKQVRI